MSIKITRAFFPADRYHYDFGACSYEKGWVQVDTKQDASYYGNWADPHNLRLFTYVEGDTALTECETEADFAAALRELSTWNENAGYGPAKIDPGFNPATAERFRALGLGDMLH